MDDITQKFLDRLKDLVALGKKKKSNSTIRYSYA